MREVHYFACAECGLVGKSPLPNPESLRAYYEKAWQFAEPRPPRCFLAAAKMIEGLVKPGQSLIDVGSKGVHMAEALKSVGKGPGTVGAIDAQPVGMEARVWVGEGYVSPCQYDIVTCTHVLEHALDPFQFLMDLRQMMTSEGCLYLEVPSLVGSCSDVTTCDDLSCYHLWHFTRESLGRLVDAAGFVEVALEDSRENPGWPALMWLGRKGDESSRVLTFDLRAAIHREYAEAARWIKTNRRPGDALYAASQGYAYLLHHWPSLAGMSVYDMYRYNEKVAGHKVLHPDWLREHGVKRLILTPRFYNSQREIGGWLREHFSDIDVVCPYPNLRLE